MLFRSGHSALARCGSFFIMLLSDRKTAPLIQIEELVNLLRIGKVQLFQFHFEQIITGFTFEHFPRIAIYKMLCLRSIILCFLFHANALRELPAQQLIIIFITAALMRCLRVTVEHRSAESIKAVLVGKLAAVITSNRNEQPIIISAQFISEQPRNQSD